MNSLGRTLRVCNPFTLGGVFFINPALSSAHSVILDRIYRTNRSATLVRPVTLLQRNDNYAIRLQPPQAVAVLGLLPLRINLTSQSLPWRIKARSLSWIR